MGGPGKFVEFRALRMIEATFTYECGGATSHGSVTTWRPGSHSGLLDCDAPGNSPDPKLRAMFRAAVKLRC